MANGDKAEALSAATMVDTMAKTVAVVIAFSLLLGITYNVAFFAYSRPDWIFHLSVADNIAATLYALPVAVVVLLVQVSWGWGSWFLLRWQWWRLPTDTPGTSIFLLSWQWLWSRNVSAAAFIGALYAAVVFALKFIPEPYAIRDFKLGVPEYVYAAGLFVIFFGSALFVRLRWTLEIGLIIVAANGFGLFVGAGLLGMEAGRHEGNAGTVIVHDQQGKVDGDIHIRRFLDGGVILKSGNDWIWIPRSQILEITEQEHPAK